MFLIQKTSDMEYILLRDCFFLFLGYAVGSMIGGLLYQKVGGSKAFKLFAATAAVCSLLHFVIYQCILKKHMAPVGKCL